MSELVVYVLKVDLNHYIFNVFALGKRTWEPLIAKGQASIGDTYCGMVKEKYQ